MPQGPLGVPRPFATPDSITVAIHLEFRRDITPLDQVDRISRKLTNLDLALEKPGPAVYTQDAGSIGASDLDGGDYLIVISLAPGYISVTAVDDIRTIASEEPNYRNMYVACGEPSQYSGLLNALK